MLNRRQIMISAPAAAGTVAVVGGMTPASVLAQASAGAISAHKPVLMKAGANVDVF